jgi:hypothetical protein
VNLQQYSPAAKQMGLEIYTSAGTPTASGPAKGAIVVDTTNGILYINEGTATAATWQNIQAIVASEISLATGSILVGTAGVAAALDAKTSGQILVGSGTTVASVAVTGDITISSAGVTAIGASKVTSSMIANQAITPTKFVDAQSVTSAADGQYTAAITAPAGFRKFVTVTSSAATNWVTLPGINAGGVGQEIWLTVGANGYELVTPSGSNNTINQVDADGTNQLDVAANTTVRCTQVTATGWIAETIAATTIAITAPDND